MSLKVRPRAARLPNELILKIITECLDDDFDNALHNSCFIYQFTYSEYCHMAFSIGCVSRALNFEVCRIISQHLVLFSNSCESCSWEVIDTPSGPIIEDVGGVPTYFDLVDGMMFTLRRSLENIVGPGATVSRCA